MPYDKRKERGIVTGRRTYTDRYEVYQDISRVAWYEDIAIHTCHMKSLKVMIGPAMYSGGYST